MNDRVSGFSILGDGSKSKDLHSLVSTLGNNLVAAKARARGWEAGEGELGQVIGQMRRQLSCSFIRSQALCLLSRIGQLGPGAKAAANRRSDALRADTARRREGQAHWQAHIKGRGLGRVGMVYIP